MSSFGATVRRAFGPYERQVSDLYRSIFINLEDLSDRIRTWTTPKNILEIGCGEGALAEFIARDFPGIPYLGIDIISHLGRMYEGQTENVEFQEITAQDLAATRPGEFDLILINDVLHHVPDEIREEILVAARTLLAPGGSLIFKDWDRRSSPIHAMCYIADVYVGGDKNVRYMPKSEQRKLLKGVFGEDAVLDEASIRPWKHNCAFLVTRTNSQTA